MGSQSAKSETGRSDDFGGTSARAYLTVKPRKLGTASRAPGRAHTRTREGGAGVTIPRNPAQVEAGAKLLDREPGWLYDLPISHFFFSKNNRRPKFC
jgi:hypothetical protein